MLAGVDTRSVFRARHLYHRVRSGAPGGRRRIRRIGARYARGCALGCHDRMVDRGRRAGRTSHGPQHDSARHLLRGRAEPVVSHAVAGRASKHGRGAPGAGKRLRPEGSRGVRRRRTRGRTPRENGRAPSGPNDDLRKRNSKLTPVILVFPEPDQIDAPHHLERSSPTPSDWIMKRFGRS